MPKEFEIGLVGCFVLSRPLNAVNNYLLNKSLDVTLYIWTSIALYFITCYNVRLTPFLQVTIGYWALQLLIAFYGQSTLTHTQRGPHYADCDKRQLDLFPPSFHRLKSKKLVSDSRE